MEIGLMRLSSVLVWKLLPWLLMTRLTPRKIWMVPPSRVVCLGVGIVVGSSIGCIHVFSEHLLSVNRTLLKQVGENMAIGATRIDHLCWFDLVH